MTYKITIDQRIEFTLFEFYLSKWWEIIHVTNLSNYFLEFMIQFYEIFEVSVKNSILWLIVNLYVIIYESHTSVNSSIYVLYTFKIDLLMNWKSKPEQEYLRNHLSLRPLPICKTNERTSPNCRYKAWTCSINSEGDITETRCLIFFGTPCSRPTLVRPTWELDKSQQNLYWGQPGAR